MSALRAMGGANIAASTAMEATAVSAMRAMCWAVTGIAANYKVKSRTYTVQLDAIWQHE